ncbi:MAG: undecaprenyl-diphosphate phosphatase [Candidatus Komeilibacteria bacterium]
MSAFFQYVLLGLVQGITEWLPISSDGHLVIAHQWLGVPANLAFDVFLHLGSLIVIIVYFRDDIWRLIRALGRPSEVAERKLIGRIIVATIFTVAVAWLLNPYIERWQTIRITAIFFIVTGIFVGLHKFVRAKAGPITWGKSVILGLAQGLAVLPGLSRSGSMLGWGLVLGIKKEEAFRFTFLAAIPAIAAAFLFEVRQLQIQPIYWVGFIVTMIVGYLSLMALELIIKRDRLWVFSIYTIILGIILLWWGQ